MSRVFFEEADRPPNEYFESDKVLEPLKKVPFQTPDPEKWIKAPEFIPRSKLLADTFGLEASTQSSSSSTPLPLMPTMKKTVKPFDEIPPGYTANMTTINPSEGPPIVAILLRKKRKRRTKNQQNNTNSMVNSSTVHSISPCSSHPSDPNESDAKIGSCPDLTEEQANEWDDYLYNNTVQQNPIYEMITPNILDVAQHRSTGSSNKELQKIDNEINGNTMTSSMVLKRLAGGGVHSDGTTEKTLAEELNFRNAYSYPQIECETSPYVHITSIDPKNSKIKNALIDKEALKAYLDEEEQEEDFLEGLNIRVNNFDTCEDLTLSDVETAPSRFQQMQTVLRNRSNVITTDLQAPGNQCCTIM